MAVTRLKPRLSKAIEILVWLAALGVLTENVVLYRQNRRLREAAAPQIAAGTQLQMLSGLTLDGRIEPVNLPSAGSKLLIITFSPGCPACQANQDGWMKLASALEKKGVRVLWVSRDRIEITRDYCTKHGVPLSDVLADPPFRTYLQLGMALVPNTVLVGPDGRVEKVWAGRLDQGDWNTMFAFFDERQETASPLQSQVGTSPTGCGSELSGASAKNCKQNTNHNEQGEKEMVTRISKVLLLVALLTTLVISSAPAFSQGGDHDFCGVGLEPTNCFLRPDGSCYTLKCDNPNFNCSFVRCVHK